MTKIQAGKLVLTPSRFHITRAMHEWIDGAALFANNHQIIVEGDADYEIEGDKNRLEQVVINLLSNAVKYSHGAEMVIVRLIKEVDCIKVSVTDFGIGIQKDKLPFVFDRYFRARENHHFSGLGLGLYISCQIVKQHGGAIGVISEEGKGSTFWFTLPLEPQPAVVD
jgi:two-component system CheB/CheR fusion protein